MHYKVEEKALLVTARVQAALELVPRMVGPAETWKPWICNHLLDEMVSDAAPHSCDIQRAGLIICSVANLSTSCELSTSQASGKLERNVAGLLQQQHGN